jgi:4-hydroxy-tetrahydrodipicolinate synthase
VGNTFRGAYTALVTPTGGTEGQSVDYDVLRRLVDFQVAQGIRGILAMGTTGESPTLSWEEHSQVIARANAFAAGRCTVIAGTGSNSTEECLIHTRQAVAEGVEAVLLVEPYYNGPSSIEIRVEYMEPVARAFPQVQVIPYVIPGRTGTQLLPEDLALLSESCRNVTAVKEASANLENMRRTREVCGPEFQILSGDDSLTPAMMTDSTIAACGVISVVSNVAPAAVQRMAEAYLDGEREEGNRLAAALQPLFEIVTVKTQERSPHGERMCKSRNPVPIKTLMRLLGVPVGVPRRPLGRMTAAGLDRVVSAAKQVWSADPEILGPLGDAFGADIEARLRDPRYREGLAYEA